MKKKEVREKEEKRKSQRVSKQERPDILNVKTKLEQVKRVRAYARSTHVYYNDTHIGPMFLFRDKIYTKH